MGVSQIINAILVFSLIAVVVHSWSAEAEGDKVDALDGYLDSTEKFEMFSGYLVLQQSPLINIHYVFLTSMSNKTTDDVVLWLNGGPGCSSMLGWAQEIGPKMLYSGSKTFASYWNSYAWNKKANLLFFESPPGVGFSINNDSSYNYTQNRTAQDNVAAIKKWFERFSEYKKNNFWIAGQSYCGMYIPYFASLLLDSQKDIIFKGIMIGNGVMWTDLHWRRKARNTFYSKHSFQGTEIQNLIHYCRYDNTDQNNPSCIKGNQLGDNSVVYVNPYATIGVCYKQSSVKLGRRRYYYAPFFEQNNPIVTELNAANSTPCTDDQGMTVFFNQQKIKTQLHVNTSIQWESCSDAVYDRYKKDNSSLQILNKLKDHKLKILLYSGNTDAVVSYVETVAYIKNLGWKEITHQKPFINDKNSLLGWQTEYDGLTLVIINGAGHMVPSDKPHAAFEMFTNFISRS